MSVNLERLQLELTRTEASDEHEGVLLEARLVIERVVAHWDVVPRPQRRELFEGFAYHIKISRTDRITKQLVIHLRDGTTSETTIRRSDMRYAWERADLEKLHDMIENNVPRVDIIRGFPEATGATLLIATRTTRHRYKDNVCWMDTE